jgi:hypothetical protein
MAKETKKTVPAIADIIKQQLDVFPVGLSETFDALRADMAAHIAAFAKYKREAEQLFDAMDGADLLTIDRYVREYPPSPGAVGFLVLVARDRFKTEAQRNAALAKVAKNEPAKKFANDDWRATKNQYKSKADYVRVNGRLIRQRFDVKVTDRTIEREWLPKVR